MIKTSFLWDLVNYDKNSLDYKINQYINNNLKEMIGIYLDFLSEENNEWAFCVAPRYYRYYCRDKIKFLVKELYDIINSNIIREYLKPKYEYILYNILCIFKDWQEDGEYELNKIDDKLQ